MLTLRLARFTPAELAYEKPIGLFVLVSMIIITFFLVFTLFISLPVKAQETDNEEVLITLQVQRVGSVEMPAIINGQTAYLPVMDVFNFLKIKNLPSAENDSITGFLIQPGAGFLVDKKITESFSTIRNSNWKKKT